MDMQDQCFSNGVHYEFRDAAHRNLLTQGEVDAFAYRDALDDAMMVVENLVEIIGCMENSKRMRMLILYIRDGRIVNVGYRYED